MSLIVEDGTGLADAESYVSAATAGAYHDGMGNSAWDAATEAAKESALRRATQYIDSQYRFRGDPLTTTQALAFPRDDGATWPIKRLSDACCELALRALTGSLFADQSGGEVLSESIGPVSVTYAPSGLGQQTRYAAVDALLAPLTAGGSRTSLRIERAS